MRDPDLAEGGRPLRARPQIDRRLAILALETGARAYYMVAGLANAAGSARLAGECVESLARLTHVRWQIANGEADISAGAGGDRGNLVEALTS